MSGIRNHNHEEYEVRYIIDACKLYIHKRHKAEKKILRTVLWLLRDLRNIVLEYSRISDGFIRDDRYNLSPCPKHLGGIAVNSISISPWAHTLFSNEQCNVQIIFTAKEFYLRDTVYNHPYALELGVVLWELFNAFINLDVDQIVSQWESNYRFALFMSTYPDLRDRLPIIAHELVQTIIWN